MGAHGPARAHAEDHVADSFCFRRHAGLATALAAAKRHSRMRKGRIDALVEAARADRIDSFRGTT